MAQEQIVLRTVALKAKDSNYDKHTHVVRVVRETQFDYFGFPSTWAVNLLETLEPLQYPKFAWQEVQS
jgi:hypothetical protein